MIENTTTRGFISFIITISYLDAISTHECRGSCGMRRAPEPAFLGCSKVGFQDLKTVRTVFETWAEIVVRSLNRLDLQKIVLVDLIWCSQITTQAFKRLQSSQRLYYNLRAAV
jgi:hypothetical protein